MCARPGPIRGKAEGIGRTKAEAKEKAIKAIPEGAWTVKSHEVPTWKFWLDGIGGLDLTTYNFSEEGSGWKCTIHYNKHPTINYDGPPGEL